MNSIADWFHCDRARDGWLKVRINPFATAYAYKSTENGDAVCWLYTIEDKVKIFSIIVMKFYAIFVEDSMYNNYVMLF